MFWRVTQSPNGFYGLRAGLTGPVGFAKSKQDIDNNTVTTSFKQIQRESKCILKVTKLRRGIRFVPSGRINTESGAHSLSQHLHACRAFKPINFFFGLKKKLFCLDYEDQISTVISAES